MYNSLDSMVRAYQREEVLLTEELKVKKKSAINERDKEIKKYQKKIFGLNGQIFLKRQELIKPIQDNVYSAIEKVAKKHKLQAVFDRAGDLTILYYTDVHDYTEYVLEELQLGDPKDTIDNPKHKKK